MASIKDTILKVPLALREKSLYKKFAEMTDYMVLQSCDGGTSVQGIIDTKYKYKDPDQLTPEIIAEIIKEYGFDYINDIVSTLQNIETNVLVHFISLLHLLKGHRDGLELILKVLGFEFQINEWWEQLPQNEPHTYNMDIFFNLSQVTDVFETLNRIRIFSENYVYPKLLVANLIVDFDLAEANVVIAGFSTFQCDAEIIGSL